MCPKLEKKIGFRFQEKGRSSIVKVCLKFKKGLVVRWKSDFKYLTPASLISFSRDHIRLIQSLTMNKNKAVVTIARQEADETRIQRNRISRVICF